MDEQPRTEKRSLTLTQLREWELEGKQPRGIRKESSQNIRREQVEIYLKAQADFRAEVGAILNNSEYSLEEIHHKVTMLTGENSTKEMLWNLLHNPGREGEVKNLKKLGVL